MESVFKNMPLDPTVKAELVAAVQEAQKTGIVQGMQRVLGKLANCGLIQSQVIEPGLIGVHPSNRDGMGLVPHSVHQLLEDIASVGFDARQCDPICTDVPPGNVIIETFNHNLAESSQGSIPPIEGTKLKYCSLSCSHTNTGLRCIMAGAPHDHSGSELTVQGKLQLEQVRLKDPAMAQAASAGLTWRVINHEAMEVEGLADLLQAGANTSAQLSRGESEFQILRRVLNQINAQGKGQIQYTSIKQSILKTKPACSEAIPEIFTFLVRHGASKHLQNKLLVTEQRMKASKVECRSLGKDFFHALGQDPKDPKQDALVLIRHAILAFAYCSPLPKQIGVQDVRKVAVKDKVVHERLKEAQALLSKIHGLYDAHDWKAYEKEQVEGCVDALHIFDDQIVLMGLDKKVQHPSFNHVACAFVDSIESITGDRFTNDYDDFKAKVVSSPSKQIAKGSVKLVGDNFDALSFCYAHVFFWAFRFHPLSRYVEFHFHQKPFFRIRKVGEDGQLEEGVQMLAELGFQVGMHVMRKSDKVKGQIVQMTGNQVTLDVHDGPITGTAQISADGFRKGQWKISKEREKPLEIESCETYSALCQSKDICLKIVQGKVAAALMAAEEKFQDSLKGLKLVLKPCRDIVATKRFSKGQLTLVPVTPKIVVTDQPSAGMVSLGKVDGFKIFLMPCFVGPDKDGNYEDCFLPPFWGVRTTHDIEKANVEWHNVMEEGKANNQVKITLLKNTKEIEEKETLLRYVAKKERAEELEDFVPVPAPKRRHTGKTNV